MIDPSAVGVIGLGRMVSAGNEIPIQVQGSPRYVVICAFICYSQRVTISYL